MKKILLGIAVFFTTAILCIVSAGAETYGDYTYTVLGDGTVEITDYNGESDAALVIPSELDGKKVTSIGEAAFEIAKITSVTIPDGVTSIGDKAFHRCTSLETISIPDSVKTIGNYAFNECGTLALINIPQGVTSIGDYAFWYCYSLTSIEFPASVTSIGEDAFADCYGLEEILVDSANKNYASADGVLFNTNMTELIMYPSAKADTSYIVPSTVTKLGGYAFADCMSLTSITLPEGLTEIGHYAFAWCGNLKTITIPEKVTTIGDCAFWYDYSLTDINVDADNKNYASVDGVLYSKDMTEIVAYPSGKPASSYDIPDGVKTIGSCAFTGAAEIETITIPAGVTSIGDYAFSDCTALKAITIPDGVISMGDYAFAWCYELKSADIADSVKSIGEYCFDCCHALETANIPKGITVIEDFTFGNCSSLKSIIIPDGVTSIGEYSFNTCRALTSIVIPDSVTSIGKYAFLDCECLESITIPESVTEIDETAFIRCKNVVINCYEDSVAHQFAVEKNIDYELIPDELTPTVVSATPGDKQVTLNWTAVEGASYYQIIRYNKGTYSLIANINGTSAVVKGLTNNFEYTYLIKAVAADGRTSLSNAVNVTPVAALAKPTLSATADDKQATLSWNAIEGASYYQIIRYNKGTYSLIANISGTSAVVKGLTNNFEYTYLIKAVAADGRTSLSNAVNVTPVAALAKPTLSAVAGDKQATLSWTAVDGASYYQIIRYNKGTYSLIANISGTSAIVKGLTNNFEYTYLIKVVAADGRTSLSNAANVTPVAALAKPTLSAVAGDKQATLSWTAVDGASYYQIIRYNKGAYSLIANIGGTSAVVKGLTNNFEYTYLVKAVLSDGTVVYSNSINVTPMA